MVSAMAGYRAISSACEAVVRLLRQSWRPALFDGADLQFQVYGTPSFLAPMDVGVSLFLYRADVSGTQRTLPHEPRRRRPLPLELSFVLTPWAEDSSLQLEILAWAMRTIEDTPILSAGFLNAAAPGVFHPEETLEIVPGHLSNEEAFRFWDVLPGDFRVSAPYVMRVVRVESEIEEDEAEPVLVRQLDYGVLAPR